MSPNKYTGHPVAYLLLITDNIAQVLSINGRSMYFSSDTEESLHRAILNTGKHEIIEKYDQYLKIPLPKF